MNLKLPQHEFGEFDQQMRLAFDVNVSCRAIGRFAREGHIIVCCCKEGESDEDFLARAWEAGADVVFSQDADIGNIIEKEKYDGMKWRRYVY